jgi:hypothetical protein
MSTKNFFYYKKAFTALIVLFIISSCVKKGDLEIRNDMIEHDTYINKVENINGEQRDVDFWPFYDYELFNFRELYKELIFKKKQHNNFDKSLNFSNFVSSNFKTKSNAALQKYDKNFRTAKILQFK